MAQHVHVPVSCSGRGQTCEVVSRPSILVLIPSGRHGDVQPLLRCWVDLFIAGSSSSVISKLMSSVLVLVLPRLPCKRINAQHGALGQRIHSKLQ